MWRKGTWKCGKKRLTGQWLWVWHRQRFVIDLDGKDPETGLRREQFEVAGDSPDFGKWKLMEVLE